MMAQAVLASLNCRDLPRADRRPAGEALEPDELRPVHSLTIANKAKQSTFEKNGLLRRKGSAQ
jgi:hypothetical protein